MNPTNPLTITKLKDTLSTTQNGILVFQAVRNSDGTLNDLLLIMISNRAELDLERQAMAILGQSIDQVAPHLVETGMIEQFRRVIKTGEPAYFDQLYSQPNHTTPIWANVSVIKLDDCLVISYDPVSQMGLGVNQQNSLLQQLFDASANGITVIEPVLDQQGALHDFRFVIINDAGLRMSNYSRQELLGRTVTEVSPTIRTNGLFTHYVETYQTGQPFTEDQYYPEYDCWRDMTIVRIPRGLMITYYDSTAKKKGEEKIRQQAKLLHTLIENVPVGIAILTRVLNVKRTINTHVDFRITWANSALKDIFGTETSQLEGELLSQVFPDANASGLLSRCINGIGHSESQAFDMPFSQKGKAIWYRITMTPQDEDLILTFTDISSIKQSQLVHHHQTEELRTVLDSSLNTILAFDALRARDGQIVDFQCTFQNRLKRHSSGLVTKPKGKRPQFDFSPHLREKGPLARYADVVKTNQPIQTKVMIKQGQQVKWRDQTVVKRGDGVVVTIINKPVEDRAIRNVSVRHRHFTSKSYETIFATATIGILICDRAGQIVLSNQLANLLLGYQAGEMDTLTIEHLVPSGISHYHQKLRQSYNADPQVRPMGHNRDLYAQRKDGSIFPVEVSLSHFHLDNELYVVAYIIDISVKKAAERQLLAHQSQIEQLNAELEQKVINRTQTLLVTLDQLSQSKEELTKALAIEHELGELKSRFVAMASHEFRTPLTTVLNSATLIGKYTTVQQQDKRQKHLDRIRASVQHLNDILEEFLSVGKLEEGKIEAHASEVDLPKLVSDILADLQASLQAGQTLQTQLSCSEPIWLDGSLLRKILVNLLTNAIKYSGPGSVVSVAASCLLGQLTMRIQDQGIGISKEDQKHLFERFFRATNVADIAGTGLGLHIVGRYINLLGGHIGIESELNQGTTITLNLPYKDQPGHE